MSHVANDTGRRQKSAPESVVIIDNKATKMSIQMSLIFATLLVQMSSLVLLLLPLPYPVRKKIIDFTFVLEKSQHFRIGVGFSAILLVMQFLDCLNRLKRYSHIGRSDFMSHDQLASKFYAQRNLYLTGAVLYLFLATYTLVSIVRKMVAKEGEYRKIANTEKGDEESEVAKYKQLIKLKEQDIATMKKQLQGLQKEYDGLTEAEPTKKED